MTGRPLGMESGYNDCVWPSLTEKDVAAILPRWGYQPAPAPLLWHASRPFSASAIIALKDGGRLFLKRHSLALRSVETLSEEHRFACYLANKRPTDSHQTDGPLPVAAPLSMLDGQTAFAWQGHVYEAFPFFEEQDAYRGLDSWRPYNSTAQAASAGTLLARLHQASEGYDAPPRNNPPLISARYPLLGETLADGLLPWAEKQAGLTVLYPLERLQKEALSILEPFHTALRPYLAEEQPLWGHGDYHGANLLWQSTGAGDHTGKAGELKAARIFDFGMCDQTSAAFDLAIAIERSFITWLDPQGQPKIEEEQLTAFLAAYDAQRPRSMAEKILTARWLPLCHVTFALSEIAYYGHILNNKEGAEISWRDYLLGHGRWFHTAAGQALLNRLTPSLTWGEGR